MLRKSVVALLFLSSLSGCYSSFVNDAHATLKQNSFPIILDAVMDIVPTFSHPKKNELLNEICKVSYGINEQKDLDEWVSKNIADTEKVDEGMPDYEILSGKNKPAQLAVCAAWLSVNMSIIPDVDFYAHRDKNGKVTGFDEKSIHSLMPIRIAVARINAELFSSIARTLEGKNEISRSVAKKIITDAFKKNSPSFLEKVKTLTAHENSRVYELILLQKGRFVFRQSDGYLFDISNEGVSLSLHGVPWLSKGKLLGNEYFVKISGD